MKTRYDIAFLNECDNDIMAKATMELNNEEYDLIQELCNKLNKDFWGSYQLLIGVSGENFG